MSWLSLSRSLTHCLFMFCSVLFCCVALCCVRFLLILYFLCFSSIMFQRCNPINYSELLGVYLFTSLYSYCYNTAISKALNVLFICSAQNVCYICWPERNLHRNAKHLLVFAFHSFALCVRWFLVVVVVVDVLRCYAHSP